MVEIRKIPSQNSLIPAAILDSNFEALKEQLENVTGLDYASKLEDLENIVSQIVNSNGFSWADITDKPSTFTPSPHIHNIGSINGLQALLNSIPGDLDGGSANSVYLLSQIIDLGGANG